MQETWNPRGWSLLAALLLASSLPLDAQARTPDGMTPAEEDVCDVLHGGTPGLYGLCVAYCEAQDCDSVTSAISGQCRAPNPRLLDHYERKRRAGDPPMPCLAPEPRSCACFGPDDLAGLSLAACFELDFGGSGALVISDGLEQNGAMVELGDGFGLCTLVVDGAASVHEISEEEAVACEEVIRRHAAGQGLVCQ